MATKEDEFKEQLNDDELEFRRFVIKIGVEFPSAATGEIGWDSLKRANGICNQEGDTLLMKAVERECVDAVEYFLRCNGIEVNAMNSEERRAIDIAWEKQNYECVVMLLGMDSLFPESGIDTDEVDVEKYMGKELIELIESRVRLHDSIEKGTFRSVEEVAGKENLSKFYSPENETAVACAIKYGRYEIYAYLISIGARLGEEEKDLLNECDGNATEKFENALEEYFVPFENSHLMKLIAGTKLLGCYGELERKAVKDIFYRLNDIQLVKSLMTVLANEKVEIVFDFDSELVDRMCPKFSMSKLYGLYLPSIHRIHIGAKNCTGEAFDDVAGTVAHELCHRAMYALYENWGSPYKRDSREGIAELSEIDKNLPRGKKGGAKEKWEEVMDVYFSDPSDDELIVRVPHILGIYGEEKGVKILKDNLPDLYNFYSRSVHQDSKTYAERRYFSKSLCSIETLSRVYGIVQEEEKVSSPFKELIEYEKYLLKMGKISILLTSSVKLCTLNVYHALKQKIPFHMEKRCLFIDLKDFNEDDESFLKVLQCKYFHCLVLASNEIDVDLDSLMSNFSEAEDDKKVIFIVDHKHLKGLKREVLRYHWENLVPGFKEDILKKLITYQGREIRFRKLMQGNSNLESEVINPEVLSYLLTKDNVSIGQMIKADISWCPKDLYIPRTFVRYTFNRLSENLETESYYLFLTGLKKEEAEMLGIKKQSVQEIEIGEEIQPYKHVIIPRTEHLEAQSVKKCFSHVAESQEKPTYWLHHENGNFYLRYSNRSDDSISGLREEEATKEEEAVMKMEKDRVVIVSDEPGAGKSTVISSMADVVYKRYPEVFLGRINLNEYAVDAKNNLSLYRIKNDSSSTEILKYFHEILSIKSCLEYSLVECYQRRNNNVIAVFDSFDEIVPFFKVNVLKLFRTLLSETKIQIWIFTRNYEKLDLELEMNACSFVLRPFSSPDQVAFLNKFWRFKLISSEIENEEEKIRFVKKIEMMISAFENTLERDKNPKHVSCMKKMAQLLNAVRSLQISKESNKKFWNECENLLDKEDFTEYSTFVLKKINSIEKPLTALPLHLFMMAEIIYNEDFTVGHHRNMFGLYFNFIESKIKTYLREKCCMKSNTIDMTLVCNTIRGDVLRDLTGVLDRLMDPNNHVDLGVKEDDSVRIAQRIGLLKEEKGNLHFIHMSISEFLYCELIKDKIKSDNLDAELFSNLLFKERYQVILRYLDDFFQIDDVKSKRLNFSNMFIKNFNVSDRFIDYMKHNEKHKRSSTSDFVGCYVWKKILDGFEKVFGNEGMNNLMLKIAKYLEDSFKKGFQRFKFLITCLNNNMVVALFDRHANLSLKFVHQIIADATQEELSEVFRVLREMLRFKIQESSPCKSKGSIKLRLFYSKDELECPGGNLFHWAAKNKDQDAFLMFLRFAEEFMERKTLKGLLLDVDNTGRSIIHRSGLQGNRNVLTILEELEIYLEESEFLDLISVKYNKLFNFVGIVAYSNHSPIYFQSLLEYLNEFDGGETLKILLLLMDTGNFALLHILHYAAKNENKEMFEISIKRISAYLHGEELIKFISRGCDTGDTIYHQRSREGLRIKDLDVVERYVRKETLLEMLKAVDPIGNTCIHTMCQSDGSTEVLVSNLCYIIEKLDKSSLEELILAVDERENTFLHKLAKNALEKDRTKFFTTLEDKLSKSLWKRLLNSENREGQLVEIIRSGRNISCRLRKCGTDV